MIIVLLQLNHIYAIKEKYRSKHAYVHITSLYIM